LGVDLRNFDRRKLEVAVLLAVYAVFLGVGIFSGQRTMSVEAFGPPEGVHLTSSPVKLAARITARGIAMPNVTARFVIDFPNGESDIDAATDRNGIARLLVPAVSGNYTWHVAAIKEGYPTIFSRSLSFSLDLSLVVDVLQPTFILATSPVEFKVRVMNMNRHMVESANVTFYVDSTPIGSSLTGPNGIASLSAPLASGRHTWFASASKSSEGGVSYPTLLIIGELASLAGHSDTSGPGVLQIGEDG
jgi:hypothetical protein